MTQAAVYGPRAKLVDRLQAPLARRTPWSADAIRSAFGAIFLVLAARRLVRAVRAGLRG